MLSLRVQSPQDGQALLSLILRQETTASRATKTRIDDDDDEGLFVPVIQCWVYPISGSIKNMSMR